MERLTRAEEEVMLILWDLAEATVRNILEKLNEPGTTYTTVGSILRILEKKGFAQHRAIGNTYLYAPAIGKPEYTRYTLKAFLDKYFDGSFTGLASFYVTENDMSMWELREMMRQLREDLREDRKEEKQAGSES